MHDYLPLRNHEIKNRDPVARLVEAESQDNQRPQWASLLVGSSATAIFVRKTLHRLIKRSASL